MTGTVYRPVRKKERASAT